MEILALYCGIFLLCAAVYGTADLLLKIAPNLKKLNLPTAVIGAILFLPFIRVTEYYSEAQLLIPRELRDLLLVIFFASMGLAIKFKAAYEGGRPLLLLSLLSVLLVILQNLIGVLICLFFGLHPAYGLLAGSISFVGGFGSSLAWGTHYAEAGLPMALEVGFACSTLGLLSGGILAGPAVALLINRWKLSSSPIQEPKSISCKNLKIESNVGRSFASNMRESVKIIIALASSIYVGDHFQLILKSYEIDLPRFLCAMLVAICLVNIVCRGRLSLAESNIDNISDLSFNTFIILGLLGMSMSALSLYMIPICIIFILQIILTVLFASEVVYRFMGKNYEAAVLSGGVVGFGLSSLAVAVATVKTIIKNHGSAPRALLLTSLVGAALIDLPNNLLIGLLSRLDFFRP